MRYDALLVVDVQTALLNDHPYNETVFLHNVKQLIELCRKNSIPVIYVRHDGGMGDELEYGTKGWEIYSEIAPGKEEVVIDKRYNSSFRQTALESELFKINAKKIILCGMQTEHCIDATCKVAFEYGYEVTMVKGGTTTFSNDFAAGESLNRYYENRIWNNRYARVVSMDEVAMSISS